MDPKTKDHNPPRATAAGLPRILRALVSRRERWGLTPAGRLLLLAILLGLLWGGAHGAHPFLAINRPVEGDYLVIEGWIPDYAIHAGFETATGRTYRRVLASGGPFRNDFELDDDDTYAHLAASKLEAMGLPAALIAAVPANRKDRDRTYASALAVQQWLRTRNTQASAIDVLTLGVHARRTRLLYRRALGPDIRVGIIAVRNREYAPARWWAYSEGLKSVVAEGLAYLYAHCFFRPAQRGDGEAADPVK